MSEIKVSKNWESYFVNTRKLPEATDRKMNTGIFFPADWETRGERDLRLKILRRNPDFRILPEKVRSTEKQARYIKIKGWAKGIKGIIKRRQTAIAIFLSESTLLSTKR
ncbi:hypothetical protein MTHERMMSTA1_16000 [Methanosarcina thermophila MST-A1]|uniref:Fatty-acyl-CoA synthase n=1 Tax=Methanosarcina thermophila TaxID=2210 RepID=A0A3G9CU10_METTE|nr:fatty-acyl-CoA synthase [Methanosarcina thermophila]GLI14474.1 hypothetical protein MTHERMMSTA1_16000 [Methanosarcina thermophila MST-A1]